MNFRKNTQNELTMENLSHDSKLYNEAIIDTNAEYKIDGTHLDRARSMRDLGVTMTCDLSYNKHIQTIRSRAFRILGLLRRNCLHQFLQQQIGYCMLLL
jgi:hypothetical protein